jgi:(R,R)-butanediol dehydrogenase/meso-butanediol dehydrogenase/diacetyl reductase
MLAKSVRLVRLKGTVVSLGFCTTPDSIIPAITCMKQVQMLFPVVYTVGEFEHCARVLDGDRVPDPRALISETVGLDALPGKIEELRGAHTQTKVQLDPWA